MPVYRSRAWLHPQDRPEWCTVAAAGRFAIPAEGGRFDRHYHDAEELWFIAAGKALIAVGDEQTYVSAGDIVLTRAGTVHDIIAVYEPLTGFFCESAVPPDGRFGHRHVDAADAAGHDVPLLTLPADFRAQQEGNACASR